MNTKQIVVSRFVDFVERYCSLKTALLATLGGLGVEADVWTKRGVQAQNGWLIERSRGRQRSLSEQHPYKSCNQLARFVDILRGEYAKPLIDGFHLDLQGTLPPSLDAFEPALGLVLSSKGKCLAITVADARRNLAADDWENTVVAAESVFGKRAFCPFYQKILNHQQAIPVKQHLRAPQWLKAFSPEKAAQREVAVALHLAYLLAKYNMPEVTSMRRYVYVSRYSGRPFRMRTYFFHFHYPINRVTESGTIESYLDVWQNSQLIFVDAEGEHIVTSQGSSLRSTQSQRQKTNTEKTKEMTTESNSNQLAALVAMVGNPTIREEYDHLVKIAEAYSKFQSLFSEASSLSQIGKNASSANTPATNGVHPGAPRKTSPRAPAEAAKLDWDSLNEDEKIKWIIIARELKAKNPESEWLPGQWKQLLEDEFGAYSAGLGAKLRTCLARSGGKFSHGFSNRIRKVFPEREASLLVSRYEATLAVESAD